MHNNNTASKTVIITGANSGLGYQCAKVIANSKGNWHIIIASRSVSRVEEAPSSKESYDQSKATELWESSVELVKLPPDPNSVYTRARASE